MITIFGKKHIFDYATLSLKFTPKILLRRNTVFHSECHLKCEFGITAENDQLSMTTCSQLIA